MTIKTRCSKCKTFLDDATKPCPICETTNSDNCIKFIKIFELFLLKIKSFIGSITLKSFFIRIFVPLLLATCVSAEINPNSTFLPYTLLIALIILVVLMIRAFIDLIINDMKEEKKINAEQSTRLELWKKTSGYIIGKIKLKNLSAGRIVNVNSSEFVFEELPIDSQQEVESYAKEQIGKIQQLLILKNQRIFQDYLNER